METDRIEKKVDLRAPLERVWRAWADSIEFASWFGMKFDGPFTSGARMRGVIVPTEAEPHSRFQDYSSSDHQAFACDGRSPPGT